MNIKLIFDGKKTNKQITDLKPIIKELKSHQEYLHSLRIEDLIVFFNQLALHWKTNKIFSKIDLKNLIDFLSKENLTTSLKIALHSNHQALDKFVDLGDKKLLFHAQPRGLSVHWLAGNVPILGLFSIFSALITKNVCLVKASSHGYEQLVELLNSINNVNTDKINGAQITPMIKLILVEAGDKKAHQYLSSAANIRIAWGGWEAVNAIVSLPKNPFCEDIIFGPKYSYAVIDKESLTKNAKKIAQRLAVDVSVFDQYACSSPHTVFIEGDESQALDFAKELSTQLELIERTFLPKGTADPDTALNVIGIRNEYILKGKVFNSKGTEWTVIYTKEEGLAQPCFSRVIFVKQLDDLHKLKTLNDRQKQTLGVALSEKNKLILLDDITLSGIDRCPDLGYLTFYEPTWDGMFVFDRLVRWVTFFKNNE